MEARVSVIIPSRGEQFLEPTIRTLLENSVGSVEIKAVCDGEPYPQNIVEDKRVTYIYHDLSLGMRASLNAAVAQSKGKYLLKSDGHCLFAEGWDEALSKDCDEDWVVIPRRKRLDAENWCEQDPGGKPDIDYMYLSYPNNPQDWGGPGLHARLWEEKNKDLSLRDLEIDDAMSFQGSAWFMRRSHYDQMELMDNDRYGSFLNEPQEIGLKTWLSGGRVVVNKKTWYAHLHKGRKYGRGYYMDEKMLRFGALATRKWLTNEAWDKTIYPFEWFVEKFWPVPEWPKDKSLWTQVPGYNCEL